MDELEKLYNVVNQREMFTGSFDEFKNKFQNNPEQQTKLFEVVSSRELFTKSQDEFSSKFFPKPLKKKDNTISVSEDTNLDILPQSDIPVSELPKKNNIKSLKDLEFNIDNISNLNEDIPIETNLTVKDNTALKPQSSKSFFREEKIDINSKSDFGFELSDKNFAERLTNEIRLKKFDIIKNDFDNIMTFTDADNQEIEKRLKEEEEIGFVDKAKNAFFKTINIINKVNTLGLSTNIENPNSEPFKQEIKQVKTQAINNDEDIDDKEVLKRAKDLFKLKEKDNILTDRANTFLGSISEDDKSMFELNKSIEIDKLSDDNNKKININNLLEKRIVEGIKELESISKKENITEEDVIRHNQLQEELKGVNNQINDNYNFLIKNQNDLQSAENEYDLLKRSYNYVFATNAIITAADLSIGMIDFGNYLNNAIGRDKSLLDTKNMRENLSREREFLRRPVSSVESVDGFLNYTSDLISNQLPILAVTSTGYGGLALLGTSSAGQKYAELNDEVLEGKAEYSPLQMIGVPLAYGGAEAIFEIPTLSILNKGRRIISASAKQSTNLFQKTIKQRTIDFVKDYAGDTTKEVLAELGTNFIQNGLDIYALGKDKDIWDNTEDVLKDSFALTSLLKISPHIVGAGLKPFQQTDKVKTLELNAQRMLELNNQLNEDITQTEKDIIISSIEKLNSESSKIMAETIKNVSDMPEKSHQRILEINKEAGALRKKALDIHLNGKSKNKTDLIKSITEEYNNLQEERINIINEPAINENISEEAQDEISDFVETQEGDNIFNPLESEGESIGRLFNSINENKTIEDVAKEHTDSYLEYLEQQGVDNSVIESDFVKSFNDRTVEALNNSNDFDFNQERSQQNGSRIDSNGDLISEIDYLREQGSLNINENTQNRNTDANEDIQSNIVESGESTENQNIQSSIDNTTNSENVEIDNNQDFNAIDSIIESEGNPIISTNLNDYNVQVENGELKIEPTFGNSQPSSSELKNITDKYIEQTNFDIGDRADFSNKENLSQSQITDVIINESNNAIEIAQEILNVKNNVSDNNDSQENKNSISKLEDRFKEITGLKATNLNIDAILSKESKPNQETESSDTDSSDNIVPFQTESNQERRKSFSNRALKSENLNKNTKDKLEKLGINYDVENQQKAEENAEKIISEIGIEKAYQLAKDGIIRGGSKTWIQAKMFEEMNDSLNKAVSENNIDEIERISNELALIIDNFSNEKKLSGQEASMLNRVYAKFDMKYDFNFAKNRWKNEFGSDPSPQVTARLKFQEKTISELNNKIKELEKKQGTKDQKEAFNNIEQVYKRNLNKPNPSSLRKAAALLRKAKFTKTLKDLNSLQSSPLGVITGVLDGAIETIAKALEIGATTSEALQKGINKIKNSKWYKELSKDNKKTAIKKIRLDLDSFLSKSIEIPINEDIEQGDIKIPPQLLYDFVAEGVNDINDLSQKVRNILSETYPNLSLREVRDAITNYGKQINQTSDKIKLKIQSLKRDGRQISALEDLEQGQAPKRSGLKRQKLTSNQRNRIKKIKDLLKKLPIDDSKDKQGFYKTALQSYKTKLENRINDLDEAIKNNNRILKEKTSLKLDKEAKDLVARRNQMQKRYDSFFGKTPKSHESLVNEILKRKENYLNNLEEQLEFIRLNKKEPIKPTKIVVNDIRINILNNRIEEAKSDLNDILNEVGIAEAKRLERSKKYIKNRIDFYNEKIKNKEFTKKPPRGLTSNKDISKLKKQLLDAKNKFESEFEKQEKKNRTNFEKLFDFIFEIWNIPKGLLASVDFSAMFRQGILLGSANPKEFAIATKRMHKFVIEENYNDFMADLETSDDFILMTESGLSITDTSGDVLKSEEFFLSNLTKKKIKIKGLNVNILGIGQEVSERAYSGFLNSLRVDVFRKGVNVLKSQGLTPASNPKEYKALAKMVNNATGRGDITSDVSVNKFLNAVFFSPRMITGMFGVLRDTYRKDSTPYVRKQAMKSLATFIAYQGIAKLLLSASFGLITSLFIDDEDKEEIDILNFDTTDTDFNKIKIGNTRYDTSAGWGIMIRTIARIVSGKKTNENGVTELNKGYKSNVWDEPVSYFRNKLSPSARQFYNFMADKHPSDTYKDREDATVYDYVEALAIPLTVSSTIQDVDDIRNKKGNIPKSIFNFTLNMYGINSITYTSKDIKKERKNRNNNSRNSR